MAPIVLFTSLLLLYTNPIEPFLHIPWCISAHIGIGAAPGTRIRKNVQESVTVEKQQTILPMPTLLEFVDLGSGTTNTSVTAENIGIINGHRLKFNPADHTEGIFFDGNSGAVTKVTAVQKHKPGELVFMIPTLPAVSKALFKT